jgi:hypothetical protein
VKPDDEKKKDGWDDDDEKGDFDFDDLAIDFEQAMVSGGK